MRKVCTVTILLVMALLPAGFWHSMNSSKVMPQERKRIAFDETHREVHEIDGTYAAFRDFIRSSGFDVEPLAEGPLTLDKLRVYSVVVLALPTKPFLSKEIDAIVEFVEGGGGLLIMGDCGNDLLWGSNINNVSSRFDVIFSQDTIRASQEPVVIRHFEVHPIIAGVSKIVYHSGSSLKTHGIATALDWGDMDVWADRCIGTLGVLEPGEARGREVTVMVTSQYGLGRVVCLGSSTLFLESNLIPDHKKLGYNILRWLSSTEPVKTSIQNGLIRVKFLDDNLHSSYQIDVWDGSTRNWTTAYHDVRFYTAIADGFNVTWNMGNSTVETISLDEYEFLVVRYPEVKQYGYELELIDVGSADDEHIVGGGWSRAFEFDNRTVRQIIAGREDIHILISYPDHPWLQYTLNLNYADVTEGRVDVNMLTAEGWTTLKSFHTKGGDGWREINVTLDPANLYVDPTVSKLRFGIHVEGEPLIVDEVSLSSVVQSGSIEVIAAIDKDSPLVYFFMRKLGNFELSSIGVVGELATKTTRGKRFAFSSLLKDAYLERGHEVMPSQGIFRRELELGSDGDLLSHSTPAEAFYIYGDGWSEGFLADSATKAREVIANRTNTFLVIPMPFSLNVLYNLSVSYLDAGVAPVDVNIFNGSKWVTIGQVKRENTGIWKTVTIPIPNSELYLDPATGGVKLGLYAYENNFIVSKVTLEAHVVGQENIAVALSGKKVDVVNFMVVPKAKDRVIQHEVDGSLGAIKTIDILARDVLLSEEKILPVVAVGSVIMDTSGLLKEIEEEVAEGWRPKPLDLAPPLVSGNLGVARLNGSSLSFHTPVSIAGQYRVFIKYYDLSKGYSDKEVAVYVNGREIGRIKYEGSGFHRFWSMDAEVVKGTNTITLTPLSKVPTSEIAYIDYVLVAPKFWEEQASYDLTDRIPRLIGDQ